MAKGKHVSIYQSLFTLADYLTILNFKVSQTILNYIFLTLSTERRYIKNIEVKPKKCESIKVHIFVWFNTVSVFKKADTMT